jgi:hypothetical protein
VHCRFACEAVEIATTMSTLPAPAAFEPVDVGWEVYAGAVAGVVPFIIGAWEFGKRIVRPFITEPNRTQFALLGMQNRAHVDPIE